MSDDSPNGLPGTPKVIKISKKFLCIAAFLGFVLLLVIMSGFDFAKDVSVEKEEKEEIVISERETEQAFVFIEGSGLAIKEDKKPISGIIGTPEIIEEKKEVELPQIVVVQGQGSSEEEEHIRRMKSQAYFAALNSPMLAKRVNTASSIVSNPIYNLQTPSILQPPSLATQLTPNGQDAYDPANDKDKEAFFERSKPDSAWLINDVRTAGQMFEMKTGTVVPSVMITGINSDLPGSLIAQVSQNVFDSTTGEHLLIPQGAKLYGVYDSRIVYGQSRVLVAWNRIIFPDGSAITLPSMPGTDMAGSAGFSDKTNNHYFRTFGSAVMMALITGGTSYAVDTMSGGGSSDENDDSSLSNQMTSALAQQIGQTTTRLLEKNLNIKPTIEIRPGYQFNIVLTKDIAFKKPYTAWR